MNRYLATYDLHLHTYYSYDACTPPAYYFEQAQKLGLRAIAITDHHNFDALPEIREAAKKFPDVGFFTGAEFTCKTPFGNMDFVCLGLPWEPTEELKQLSQRLHQYQIGLGEAMSAIVQKVGGEFTEAERRQLLLSYRPEYVVNLQVNTHVRHQIMMKYLIDKGVIPSSDTWSDLLWGKETEYWKTYPEPPPADEVSAIVHRAGAIMLIAHPTNYFKGQDLNRMDQLREFANFDGIECAHPSTSPRNGKFWREYCEKYHLLSSGGTDTHADPPHAYLHLSDGSIFGEHLGRDEWLDELCQRISLCHGKNL